MPINPNTRYSLEAKLIESAFQDCQVVASKCTKFIKRSSIAYIISVLLTLALIIYSMIVEFSYQHIYFIIIIVIVSICMVINLKSASNLIMKSQDYEDIKKIVYGDKYYLVEVNPEKLFNYTSNIRNGEGKTIEYIKTSKRMFIMAELILAIIVLHDLFILVFV